MPDALPRLTAAQAAARLGVKPATLYAYVSRGLIARQRTSAGSTFDPLEIEGFARARRRSPDRGVAPLDGPRGEARSAGSPLMVLDTDIAEVEDDELYFRGRAAAELIDVPLERVAAWLWDETRETADHITRWPDPSAVPDAAALPVDVGAVNAARRLVAALPDRAAAIDRLHAAVLGLAATDPLRYDASRDNLVRAGGAMLTGIPRALTPPGAAAPPIDASVAAALWTALAGAQEESERSTRRAATGIRALNAALVLLVDHDLAVSTLAARVAASAHASGYAVVTAALGAFDSPLHGNASRAAAELLAHVVAGADPAAALAQAVRDGGRGVPGFGHPLYAGTDARARALLPLIAELPDARPVMAAVDAVSGEVARRAGIRPNVDLALAALTLAAGLSHDAGVAVFAVGRIVGWIAHAAAEYGERPMRLRPRGRYVGP